MDDQKPDCYKCIHRRNVPGDRHSSCMNIHADVDAELHGIKKGWFIWPFNFDPIWLINCNGFKEK